MSATIHPIKCDQCDDLMLFFRESGSLGNRQIYDCNPRCNRRAIVYLKRSGGVNFVEYGTRDEMRKAERTGSIVEGAATLIFDLFKRK
jgi:hypothetical protein